MTREEAMQIMSTWLVSSKGAKGQRGYIEGWFDEEDVKAFRMAIEALSTEQRGECGKDCRCYYHDLEDGDTLYKLESWDGGMDFVYIRDIKFCPICGRKLESEADE